MIAAILTSLDRTSKLIFFKTPQNFHTQTHDLRKKKKKRGKRKRRRPKQKTGQNLSRGKQRGTWFCVVLSSREEKGVRESLYKPKPQEPRADGWNTSRRARTIKSVSAVPTLGLVDDTLFRSFYATVINSERREGLLITSAAFDPSPPPTPTPPPPHAPKIAPARPNARVHTQRRTIPCPNL